MEFDSFVDLLARHMASKDAELEAVESALNALAFAESDRALEKVIARLLPGLLSALASSSQAARAKCIEALQHVNLRTRAAPNISLPFDAVLEVAIAPNAAVMTRNVAIQGGYVARCFARHPDPQRAWVNLVVAASAVKGVANRHALFALALKALSARVAATTSRSNTDDSFQSELNQLTEHQMQELLSYGLEAMRAKTREKASVLELLALTRLCSEFAGVQQPARAAKVFPLLLIAAGDTSRGTVCAAGESALKRMDACDVLLQHDPGLVQMLFDLFLDPAAGVPVRCLVLSKGLLRAYLSASCFPEVLDVIDLSVYRGEISDRLRSFGMQYISFVIANATEPVLIENFEALHTRLRQLMTNDTGGGVSHSPALRGFAYTAVGELVVRLSSSPVEAPRYIPELYFATAQSDAEPEELRSAASFALLTLAGVFSVSGGDTSGVADRSSILNTLYSTILNLDERASNARAAAVLWANQCFPFSNPDARVINVIAAGDDRSDVRDAAISGLSPRHFRKSVPRTARSSSKREDESQADLPGMSLSSHSLEQTSDGQQMLQPHGDSHPYPHFPTFVTTLCQHLQSADSRGQRDLRAASWAACFGFARRCLAFMLTDLDNVSQHRTATAVPVELPEYVRKNSHVRSAFEQLRSFADTIILRDTTKLGSAAECAALHLVLIGAEVDFNEASKRYASSLSEIVTKCKRMCASGGGSYAAGLARLCSIAACSLSNESAVAFFEKHLSLLEPNQSGRPSGRHGDDERESAALCLGYTVACFLREGRKIDDGVLRRAMGTVCWRLRAAVESSVSVRVAACSAISVVAADNALPLRLNAAETADEDRPLPTREMVVATLVGILCNEKSDAALVEAASVSLGLLCVTEPRATFRATCIETLLDLCARRKEDESRFTAAESLVRATVLLRLPSPSAVSDGEQNVMENELTTYLSRHEQPLSFKQAVEDNLENTEQSSFDLEDVLQSIVRLCENERPFVRSGACIYLVTFLRLIGSPFTTTDTVRYKFSSSADKDTFITLQKRLVTCLPNAQRALIVLLGDRSEFVQQLAARGIAMISDMSSESVRRELVQSLVRSLTVSRARAATTVAGDEDSLLDMNGLPQANSSASDLNRSSGSAVGGGGAATYKQLCSLATDIGQPNLIYKFLDLAGHAALWNSRKGAALAGSALFRNDIAAEQLRPHLRSLIPRLYVYCYDPSESVRVAMSSILKSIVVTTGFGSINVVVTEQFDAVCEHCLACMTSREWRVREAGAAALRDLLSSRRWEDVELHITQFWYITLRAMDDIKESVRKTAEGAGRALSALSVRLCDPSMSGKSTATAAVPVVVRCLMPSFTHPVKEIRVLISKTLAEIIRLGGSALRSSTPDIIEFLLESATELEPAALNYVQFHLNDRESELLESARADVAQMSNDPVIESLERMVDVVDEENASEVVTKLVRMSKTGVGIPTRAATARFFCSLLSSRAALIEPFAAKLMNASISAARSESGPSARRAWGNAVGLAARLAQPGSVAKLVQLIRDLATSEKAHERSLASYFAVGLWKNSPETARKCAADVLPYAYMGRFEGDENAKGAAGNWKEVWSEGAPNTDAALRIYAEEITSLCASQLSDSSQYEVKRSAAAALGAVAAAHNATGRANVLAQATQALIAALPGHIWDGKDVVLSALGNIAEAAEKYYKTNDSYENLWGSASGVSSVVSAILKECARGKREYRLSAMSALEKTLASCREHGEYLRIVMASLHTVWEKYVDGSDTQNDVARMVWETGSDADAVDARNRARKAERAATIAALKCVTAAYPSPKDLKVQMDDLQVLMELLVKMTTTDREVQTAALECMSSAVLRTDISLLRNEAVVRQLFSACLNVLDATHAGLRRLSYKTLSDFCEKVEVEYVRHTFNDAEMQGLRTFLQRDVPTVIEATRLKNALKIEL